MNTFLNITSVISTIIVILGIIYFLLNNTIGRLAFIKKFIYRDTLYIFIGIIFILFFFEFHLPR